MSYFSCFSGFPRATWFAILRGVGAKGSCGDGARDSSGGANACGGGGAKPAVKVVPSQLRRCQSQLRRCQSLLWRCLQAEAAREPFKVSHARDLIGEAVSTRGNDPLVTVVAPLSDLR